MLLALFIVVAAACDDAAPAPEPTIEQPPTTVATTLPPATTPPPPPVTTTVAPPSEHRIGVRSGADGAEFFDRLTGETWIARGFNHWRWELRGGYLMDQTFRAGAFNHLDEAKADLAAMADYGYNAVRIWFAACFDGAVGCFSEGDASVRREYLANVADYLWTARELGIQVMFTVDDLVGDRYTSGMNRHPEFEGYNRHDLTAGGIEDQVRFWEDVVGGLIDAGAPLDVIWAYELRNEQFFEANRAPFGVVDEVTTANGETYDLTDPAEVKRMLDEGQAHWARTLASTIKALDPTALVTVGFFASGQGPRVFGPPDQRLVDPRPILEVGEIDFIDFREYPGFMPGGWDTVWANSLLGDAVDVPIVMGEFGAFYSAYDTIEEAITAQTDWLAKACAEGFDGYLGWVWDNLDTYDETWDAVGNDGAIAAALSPAALPDPCDAPPPATGNLAYAKPTTASLWEESDEFVAPPSNAVDGSEGTWWTAPDAGPQWIEIDLVDPAAIDRIRLHTDLGADTPLRVVVELLAEDRSVVATHEFTTKTSTSSLTLEHTFNAPPTEVRFVRMTTYRDAWIIWHEIEVYGHQ